MLKEAMKQGYLKALFLFPHNNIFEFHHVSDCPPVDLSPRKIKTEAFYRFIESHGPYIPAGDIVEKKELDRTGAITFDDGLEDVYRIAYPFLGEKKIPFTIFVLSEKLDRPGYMTKAQLLEMAADPLVTIGSHGTDHTKLGEADEKKQRVEIIDSKKQIEDITGRECAYFAYPFGSYNEITLRLAHEGGYVNAFAVKGRPLTRENHKDPYTVPRLSIEDNTLRYYNPA